MCVYLASVSPFLYVGEKGDMMYMYMCTHMGEGVREVPTEEASSPYL